MHAPLAPLRITALGGGMMGGGMVGTGAAAATTATVATSTTAATTSTIAAAAATTIVAGLRGARHGGFNGPERLRVVNQPLRSAAASRGVELARGEVLALWVGVDPNPWQGVDPNPNPSQVLALWVGVDVPRDAKPDLYHGPVRDPNPNPKPNPNPNPNPKP